ncbi:MAG TPA: hypothetical protein PLP59_09905 [Thermotogota bacterium]|nr:hypothetical protein [Thermotogota bacterium]
MADFAFNIESVNIAAASSLTTLATWPTGVLTVDLGKTRGGGSIRQEVEEFIVESDQSADPEYVGIKKAPKTLTLNLLDLKAANLAIAFAGTVGTGALADTVTIPNLPDGIERAVKIVTVAIGSTGKQLEIIIPRCKFKGNSELSLNRDDASTLPLEGTVLAPNSGAPMQMKWLSS